MSRTTRYLTILLVLPSLIAIAESRPTYPWLTDSKPVDTLAARIQAPKGFDRIEVAPGSFADWLRHLPLKQRGTFVRYWNGQLKPNQDAHAAVIDLDFIGNDLQQCIDAIIRLRAEYLWSVGRADEIAFSYSCSREPVPWQKWRQGWRTHIYQQNGRDAFRWVRSRGPDASRAAFRDYLYHIMMYAGTWSLSVDMQPIQPSDVQVGDAFVQGAAAGYGHAVLVLDMATNAAGKRIVLLGQSYLPAQDFHVLKNPLPDTTPWYNTDFGSELVTPEWTFVPEHARRFRSYRPETP